MAQTMMALSATTIIEIDEADLVRIVLEFLERRELFASALALERETGLMMRLSGPEEEEQEGSVPPLGEDGIFLRTLILEGAWDDVLGFAEPLAEHPAFRAREFERSILEHKYYELLALRTPIESLTASSMADSTAQVPNGSSTAQAEASEVRIAAKITRCLRRIRPLCLPERYQELCSMLGTDQPLNRPGCSWTTARNRVNCFRTIRPLVRDFLPPLTQNSGPTPDSPDPSPDRLTQLLVKGLVLEEAVDWCHYKATGSRPTTRNGKRSLLTGSAFGTGDISFLAWLKTGVPDAVYLAPFQQRPPVEVRVRELVKPELLLETSWCAAEPDGPTLARSTIFDSGCRPKTFPYTALPTINCNALLPSPRVEYRSNDVMNGVAHVSYPPEDIPLSHHLTTNGTGDSTSNEPGPGFGRFRRELWAKRPVLSTMNSTTLGNGLAPAPQTADDYLWKDYRIFTRTAFMNRPQTLPPDNDSPTIASSLEPGDQENDQFLPTFSDSLVLERQGTQTRQPSFSSTNSARYWATNNGSARGSDNPQQPVTAYGVTPDATKYGVRISMGNESLRYRTDSNTASAKPDKRLEEVPRFVPVTRLEDSQVIRAAAFHPNGKVYAVGSNTKILRICFCPDTTYVTVGQEPIQPHVIIKRSKHHQCSIYCVAWNPSGDIVATGSNDHTIKLVRFNPVTNIADESDTEISIHDGTVRGLLFLEDSYGKSSLLVSAGSGDCKIYVTDVQTAQPILTLEGHSSSINSLYSSGGCTFVTGSQDRTIRFWDLRSPTCVHITSAATSTHQGSPVTAVCTDSTDKLMVAGHQDATVWLYDIRGRKTVQVIKPHTADVRAVSFSPNGTLLMTSSYDKTIRLSNVGGDLTRPLETQIVAEHCDKVIQSHWHPKDFSFVSTSADRSTIYWAIPSEVNQTP